jgi:hypothetical protein
MRPDGSQLKDVFSLSNLKEACSFPRRLIGDVGSISDIAGTAAQSHQKRAHFSCGTIAVRDASIWPNQILPSFCCRCCLVIVPVAP